MSERRPNNNNKRIQVGPTDPVEASEEVLRVVGQVVDETLVLNVSNERVDL